jgi:hypothetical protein
MALNSHDSANAELLVAANHGDTRQALNFTMILKCMALNY